MIRSFYTGLIRQAGAGSKRKGVYIRAAVSLAIIAGLVWWLSGDALLQAIAAIQPLTWLLVVSGFILGHLLSAFKWRLLLGAVGVRLAGLDAVRAHGAGVFANLCLPSVVGGDVIRAALVMRSHQRYEQVALGSLADRVNDTFALMLMAAVAALLVPAGAELATGWVLGVIALLLTGVIVTLLAVIMWLPLARLPEKVAKITLRLREALSSLRAAPGVALLAFVLSLCIQSFFVTLNMLLARDIGIETSAAVWFFAWPLAKLVALAPVSLGGIGVREVAIAGLMVPFGLDAGLVVAQSLSWEAVLIASGLFAGLMVAMLPMAGSAGRGAGT